MQILILCGHNINYIDSNSNFLYEEKLGLRSGKGLLDWLSRGVITNALSIVVRLNKILVYGFNTRLYSGEK